MQVLQDVKQRIARLKSGFSNSIPYTLAKLRDVLPGIEKGFYIIVTASTKVGKSQLTDFLFVFAPLSLKWLSMQYDNNPTGTKPVGYFKDDFTVDYISLELSKLEKEYSIISHFATLKSERYSDPITIEKLKSIRVELDQDVLTLLEGMGDFLTFVENRVTIVDDLSTAIQIMNYIRTQALKYGKFDEHNRYIPNNPYIYRIFIIDHLSLMLSDNIHTSIFSSIEALSKFMVSAKKIYGFTFVPIQQQAAQAENIQSIQFRNAEPTLDNLADNKGTARDANLVLGLYSPMRNRILNHHGLDVSSLGDNYRSLHILADRNYGQLGSFIRLHFDGSWNNFQTLNTK